MTTEATVSTADSTTVAASPQWALTHAASHARLWTVAVVGLAADLLTKEWAFSNLSWREARPLIPNLMSLQLSLNPGALFGMGAGFAPVFVGASVLALMFVLYLFANSTTQRRTLHVALGLVLAGALGNLYDRIAQQAYVAKYVGGSKVVGTLVKEQDGLLYIGDFPSGRNDRPYRPGDAPGSGLQPVVRDFIKIEAKLGRFALWPWIFNLADVFLVVGVAALLLNFWFDHNEERRRPRSPANDDNVAAPAR